METAGGQGWFLRKHADGSVFGPLDFAQVRRWADAAQIAPHDKISQDQQIWLKAPMFPELEMDWLVEVSSERYYGPTTLGAVREFVRLGEIGEETFVINSCDGSRLHVRELPAPGEQTNESAEASGAAPPASSMAINLRDRIADLEQSLAEERRALRECEARARELDTQYRELLQEKTSA